MSRNRPNQRLAWLLAALGLVLASAGCGGVDEAARGSGGQGGRTMEIQRLVGRSLRAVTDMYALGDLTITLDCDVIQADGGTRTAAISGAFVALSQALAGLRLSGALEDDRIAFLTLTCGVYPGQ